MYKVYDSILKNAIENIKHNCGGYEYVRFGDAETYYHSNSFEETIGDKYQCSFRGVTDEQIYHDSILSCGSSNNKQLRDMFRSACKINNIEITECSKFYDKDKILLTIKKAEESVKKEHDELSEKYSEKLRIQSEINKRNEELKAKSEEIKNLINNK